MMESTFSALRFVSNHTSETSTTIDDFFAVAEQMQMFLIEPRKNLGTEGVWYNDLLNRAVLGFSDARRHVMAMLHNELVKRNLQYIQPPHSEYESLAEAVYAEIVGMHVLELVIKDSADLEEIQVVGTRIFEVRNGCTRKSPYQFQSLKEVERIQHNLVLFNQELLSPRKRWAEVMLIDGSRVTMTGFGYTSEPTLTIRFYPVREYSLRSLSLPAYDTINETLLHMLQAYIRSYLNIVIIGATNSGKTHLMKCLIAEMPDEERIVTIESRLELLLHRDFPSKNIVEYEVEEEGEHTSIRAFKLALRQSPKRIIHAEIRDEDANIYVRACTRGHAGSMTTVHANVLEDVPDTITDMCMLDQRGMNPERLRKRIVEHVVHIGIHMSIMDGSRKLSRMVEYGIENNDEIVVRELACYDSDEKQWTFPQSMSSETSKRVLQYDSKNYEWLVREGRISA